MHLGHGKLRMKIGGDRLSRLPDELIHKILSSFDIKEVIELSVLSSRWRFIWTSMPYLNFSRNGFSRLSKFAKFVTHVLSRRSHHAEVYSLNFNFIGKPTQSFVKRILNYAFSHNIQQFNVKCWSNNSIGFPLSLFTSRSLKQLSFANSRVRDGDCIVTSDWELPSLTTLDLHSVNLRDDNDDECINVFSKCANLKNLTLKYFSTQGSKDFSIVHPRLSNLTLEDSCHVNVVNVAAPQLKNLTIRDCHVKLVISAPNLASFLYKGFHQQLNLSTDGFQSLETADIRVTYPKEANAHQIVSALQVLHNVSFLTLNPRVVELLSSSGGLLLHQLYPFFNLKCLKICPIYCWGDVLKKELLSAELKNYLLDISAGCTFTIILPEEIIAERLMAELRELLAKEKDNTRQKKARVKTYKSNPEMMAQFESCWGNLVVQIEQSKKNAWQIISKLQHIEGLLVTLPASRRAKIQLCFSSLCAEASITISKITDCIMICCVESQRRSNVILHELATGCITTRLRNLEL